MDIRQINEELGKTLNETNKEYEIPFSIVFEGTIRVMADNKHSAYTVAEKLTRNNDSQALLEHTAEAYIEGTELSYEIEALDRGSIRIDYSNYRNID